MTLAVNVKTIFSWSKPLFVICIHSNRCTNCLEKDKCKRKKFQNFQVQVQHSCLVNDSDSCLNSADMPGLVWARRPTYNNKASISSSIAISREIVLFIIWSRSTLGGKVSVINPLQSVSKDYHAIDSLDFFSDKSELGSTRRNTSPECCHTI